VPAVAGATAEAGILAVDYARPAGEEEAASATDAEASGGMGFVDLR
jgi:hypothetical protein